VPSPVLVPVILSVLAVAACDYGKEPTRKLLDAISTGDVAEVQRLLPKIKQINAPDAFDGAVYLHRVAGSGDPEMLKRLVARGGDRGARLRIAELLLAKGADLKAAKKDGSTPLHMSAHSGDAEMIAFLVAKGADQKAVDMDGHTPLHVAVLFGDVPAAAESLIQLGSELGARDKEGCAVLHLVARVKAEDEAMAELLLRRGADIRAVDKDGQTPLHEAYATGGKENLIRLLIARGADPKVKDHQGRTPHACASAQDPGASSSKAP
jgi:ankyrin repeat protein